MGYYINQDSNGKALPTKGIFKALIEDGGSEIETNFAGGASSGFKENLVCVVNNGNYEAAGYCYDIDEYRAFSDPNDFRLKRWLTHPKAKELSGYKL